MIIRPNKPILHIFNFCICDFENAILCEKICDMPVLA